MHSERLIKLTEVCDMLSSINISHQYFISCSLHSKYALNFIGKNGHNKFSTSVICFTLKGMEMLRLSKKLNHFYKGIKETSFNVN